MALFRRRSAPASLTLTTAAGDKHADPSGDLLLVQVQDLGEDDVLVLSRSEEHYAQVCFLGGRYLLERRAGGDDAHEHAQTEDYRVAQQELLTWAYGPGSGSLDWEPGYGT